MVTFAYNLSSYINIVVNNLTELSPNKGRYRGVFTKYFPCEVNIPLLPPFAKGIPSGDKVDF